MFYTANIKCKHSCELDGVYKCYYCSQYVCELHKEDKTGWIGYLFGYKKCHECTKSRNKPNILIEPIIESSALPAEFKVTQLNEQEEMVIESDKIAKEEDEVIEEIPINMHLNKPEEQPEVAPLAEFISPATTPIMMTPKSTPITSPDATPIASPTATASFLKNISVAKIGQLPKSTTPKPKPIEETVYNTCTAVIANVEKPSVSPPVIKTMTTIAEPKAKKLRRMFS
jgi:hypothetical protein